MTKNTETEVFLKLEKKLKYKENLLSSYIKNISEAASLDFQRRNDQLKGIINFMEYVWDQIDSLKEKNKSIENSKWYKFEIAGFIFGLIICFFRDEAKASGFGFGQWICAISALSYFSRNLQIWINQRKMENWFKEQALGLSKWVACGVDSNFFWLSKTSFLKTKEIRARSIDSDEWRLEINYAAQESNNLCINIRYRLHKNTQKNYPLQWFDNLNDIELPQEKKHFSTDD